MRFLFNALNLEIDVSRLDKQSWFEIHTKLKVSVIAKLLALVLAHGMTNAMAGNCYHSKMVNCGSLEFNIPQGRIEVKYYSRNTMKTASITSIINFYYESPRGDDSFLSVDPLTYMLLDIMKTIWKVILKSIVIL